MRRLSPVNRQHRLRRGLRRSRGRLERDRDAVARPERSGQRQREYAPGLARPRGHRDGAWFEHPCFPGLARRRRRQANHEIGLSSRRDHDRCARVRIRALWRERDHPSVRDTRESVRVFVALQTRRADDGERDEQQNDERGGNEQRDWTRDERAELFDPVRGADGARATMAQNDPRPQVARRLDVDRADRSRLVERCLECREIARALLAGREVRRDRLALALVERAEHVRGEVFGRMTIKSHCSSTNRSRSLFIPRRTRLFTVPSGVFVRAAISVWEYPPQNARARTSRCSTGSSPTALRTRSARTATMTRSSTFASDRSSLASSIATSRSTRLPRVRRQSIAAFRLIARSHVRTEPRSGRYE